MIKDKLPDKTSELIRLALKDLELVEQDPKYRVNMFQWYTIRENICTVCLAGSVLAKTMNVNEYIDKVRHLGNNFSKIFSPNTFSNYISGRDRTKLELLDTFRKEIYKANKFTRFVDEGFFSMETLTRLIHCDFGYYNYETNPEMFKQRLLWIAEILEQEGF